MGYSEGWLGWYALVVPDPIVSTNRRSEAQYEKGTCVTLDSVGYYRGEFCTERGNPCLHHLSSVRWNFK